MNFPENTEATAIAQKKAKEEYPDDLSMQEYIYDGQMHDYAELRELLSGRALDPRLRSAAAKIASENANDFSMHLYCLNEQREALQKLDELAPQINNNDAIKRVFSRIAGENHDDFSMQHYEMEQQIEAKRKLDALTSQISGHDTLKRAFARVITEYPDDFTMQHYEMEQQFDAMKKLEGLSPVINRNSTLQHALSQAKSEYPDDFSMQHYELEGQVQRAGTPDHLGSTAAKGDCMYTRIGQLETLYSARGIPSYRIELWHDGLNKHRLIKGSESGVVQHKARLQTDEWDKKWADVYARENDRQIRQTGKTMAALRTEEALAELDRLGNVLKQALDVDTALDWDALKDTTEFSEPRPEPASLGSSEILRNKPPAPTKDDVAYHPRFGLLDKIFASRREKVLAECRARFENDYRRWEQEVAEIDRENAAAEEAYRKAAEEAERQYEVELRAWESHKANYLEQQRLTNVSWDNQRAAYLAKSPDAVCSYCDMVLSSSAYPDYFPQEFDVAFNAEAETLVVDYALPSPEDIPRLKGVKYVSSRDAIEEQYITEAQHAKLYDEVLYQVVLRSVYELFRADTASALQAVVFNGYVTSTDRGTGQQVTACVLSIHAHRDEFMALNLANIEPKACFKRLKGVGSAKLHGLAAVPPIMQLPREDGRFVSSYEVADTLDSSSNLAAMDWEDFEHLIREVFEKEFSSSGGEVKVTQASRDGGVDAIAFDPDPIRGGKIVIQAKRYTNTVGVSAVRDLYGTVMNEGANKGILVTTSDFGPDSYAFAQGKPLVLLTGGNLLHLLQKHGHKARIDINEARKLALASNS